jgi:ribosomal protein L29
MKTKELRSLGVKDLEDKKDEVRKELIKINSQIATGTTPKNPSQARNYKKTIAKINLILQEKEEKLANE